MTQTTSDRKEPVERPQGTGPYWSDLFRIDLLTREAEQRLFERLGELKELIESVEQEDGETRDISHWHEERLAIRNRLVESCLRLVVSIAKRFRPASHPEFFDLISEGNASLMRAVDLFQVGYGYRFSTYATTAIRRSLASLCNKEQRQRSRYTSGDAKVFEALQAAPELPASMDLRQIHGLLKTLCGRERDMIVDRFGFGEKKPMTFRELGKKYSLSKERVRQIVVRGLTNLRATLESQWGMESAEEVRCV